jgi:hypothetical protein
MYATSRPSRQELLAARPALMDTVVSKARRFASTPREGYLAGYYPPVNQSSHSVSSDAFSMMSESSELRWIYAVAEQDIPTGYYRWHVVETDGHAYRVVIDLIDSQEGGPAGGH